MILSDPQESPNAARTGKQTSEFGMAALALVLGVVLVLCGEREIGAGLVAVATGSYSLARGLAKKGN